MWCFALSILKRLRDIGRSKSELMKIMIPFVNIIFIVELATKPSVNKSA